MRDDAGYRGVLRMRGLPFSTVVDEVLEFFGQSASLKRENVHLMRRSDGRASGDAYAVFDTEEAAVAALSFDKQKLGTRWLGPSPRPSPNPRPDPSPSPSPSPNPSPSPSPNPSPSPSPNPSPNPHPSPSLALALAVGRWVDLFQSSKGELYSLTSVRLVRVR